MSSFMLFNLMSDLNIVPGGITYSYFTIIALLVTTILYFISRKKRAAQHYEEVRSIKVCTFANHKGGVGKSTIAFFTVKNLCLRYPEKKILVIDGSTAGDLTKLCFGPTIDGSRQRGENAVESQCTIESFVEHSRTKISWYQFWKRKPNTIDHVYKVNRACNEAPSNLYIMTNRMQYSYEAYQRVPDLDDADISRVCAQIRRDLSEGQNEWIILVDTDGGEMHGFTRLALCLANSIVIPLSAFMGAENDAWRLEPMFQYADKLRQERLSNATVAYAFFNNLRSRVNDEFRILERFRSPFTPTNDAGNSIRAVIRRFDDLWIPRYPDLLAPLRSSDSFGAIRSGGVDFNVAALNPWTGDVSNAQEEIDYLVDILARSFFASSAEGGARRLF